MKDASDWLRDPTLYATSAMAILMDRWGTEFIEWDPVTLDLEINSEFGVQISPDLSDRINAASTLFTSNLFMMSLEHFSAVCNALNFGLVTSETFLPADLDDILWGVTEATLLMGDIAGDQRYSHNIARYVGALLSEIGLKKAPSVLAFAEFDEYETMLEDDAFDDEISAKLWYDRQEEEKNSLEADNNTKIMLLLRQLSMIPLPSGNVDFIKSRLTRLSQPRPEQLSPVPF